MKELKKSTETRNLTYEEILARLGDSVAIRAESQGIPVYAFGYTYIYGVSPDFIKESHIQEGNLLPQMKIQPKKSWEIIENKLGMTPPRVPRTAKVDRQPLLSINLIDGDPETYWSSRLQNQLDVEPAWIRIDLAVETRIKAVIIFPREDNHGMPTDISIKVSRDGWHWDIIYNNPHFKVQDNTKPYIFSFDPRPAKQVWIIGNKLSTMYQPRPFFAFSVAEIQVIDEAGDNVALVSRGTGVTVSSCDFGLTSPREMYPMLWPTHYDLGVKWIRVGYAAPNALNWNFVEKTKGEYSVDTEAEHTITKTLENGINIVLCLAFTNWIYTPQNYQDPKWAKQIQQSTETYGPGLPPANGHSMLEGYKNFVQFMVRHFKDRIKYYEIWNEPPDYGGMGGDSKLYAKYVREVVPIIRDEYPEAKIVLGSVPLIGPYGTSEGSHIDDLKIWLEEGLGCLVDVIAWHPCFSCKPDEPEYKNYPAIVKELKRFAESHGFHGEYMATEWNFFAPYPLPRGADYAKRSFSELVKAKHAARFAIMNAGLDVYAFWNETWADYHVDWDCGLFRNTFSTNPINPTQPQPVYYILRTLSTVLETTSPVEMSVCIGSTEQPFEYFAFELPNKDRLFAIWISGLSKDVSNKVKTDLSFPHFTFKRAIGIDILNGTEQELILQIENNRTTIKNILVKDYPIVFRLIKR